MEVLEDKFELCRKKIIHYKYQEIEFRLECQYSKWARYRIRVVNFVSPLSEILKKHYKQALGPAGCRWQVCVQLSCIEYSYVFKLCAIHLDYDLQKPDFFC